jgi:hypothetical protein
MPDASGERWLVTEENDDSMREKCRTKDEAVRVAKTHARAHEPSQVKVHRHDGNMEYESTCGNDPRRSPG